MPLWLSVLLRIFTLILQTEATDARTDTVAVSVFVENLPVKSQFRFILGPPLSKALGE